MDGSVQERPGVGVVGVVLLLCLLSFAVHIKMPSVCLRKENAHGSSAYLVSLPQHEASGDPALVDEGVLLG